MDKQEIINLKTTIHLLEWKIEALVKALGDSEREIYRESIKDSKEVFLVQIAPYLDVPKEKISQYIKMLDFE